MVYYPGLVGLITFSQGGGSPIESFNQGAGTISGSGTQPVWQTSTRTDSASALQGLDFSGSGTSLQSYVDFGANPMWQDLGFGGGTASAPMTLIMRAKWSGSTRGGLAERNDGNTAGAGWVWGCQNTGTVSFVHEYSTTNINATTLSTLTTNKWTTIALTWTGGSIGTTAITHYFDGRVQSNNPSGANGAGNVLTDATRSLRIGNASFNPAGINITGSWPGSIGWVACFKRCLSAGEIQNWSMDAYPWWWFSVSPGRRNMAMPATSVTEGFPVAGTWAGSSTGAAASAAVWST
jgi:hypothetical protein